MNNFFLPEGFTAGEYKSLNADLEHLTLEEATLHYVFYGRKEERVYKAAQVLPADFNADVYKLLNSDLQVFTNTQAELHYLQFGKNENRIYKISQALPVDFNSEVYKSLYKDIRKFTNSDAELHFIQFGRNEKRPYTPEQLKYGNMYCGIPGADIQTHSNEENFRLLCKSLIGFLPTNFPSVDKHSTKKSIIVETRNLLHNEFVIKNTIQKLGDGWGHIIFCGTTNHEQIKTICKGISENIEIVLLDNEVKSNDDYNNLLLDINFWNRITAEKILVYQTDTFILKELDAEFLEFDYIGAPWTGSHLKYLNSKIKSSKRIEVGNGGLSIRSVEKSKSILQKHPPLKNKLNYESKKLPEDIYFSKYFTERGFKVADTASATRFSFETELVENTFGCHQPWRFFKDVQEMKNFLPNAFFRKGDKKRVLFINHQESLTGAPKLLKEIIKRQREADEFDCFILSKVIGDDEWRNNKIFRLNELEGNTEQEKILWLSNLLQPDLIVANSTETMYLARYFTCPKIIFIHEYRALLPYKDELKILKDFDKVIVANEGARNVLKHYGVESELSEYYLDVILPDKNYLESKGDSIISIGYAQFRKGIDRFIQLAKKMPNEKFVWVGSLQGVQFENGCILFDGWNYQEYSYKIHEPIRKRNYRIEIPNNVSFVGAKSQQEIYEHWISNAKLLLMLSYDDPFPLVVIDAKALNKNVVNLKEAGDSYKICDENDLVLDEFDEGKIISYIRNLKRNTTRVNFDLINKLRFNYSPIDDTIRQFLNREKENNNIKVHEKLKVFTAIHADSLTDSYNLLEKTVKSLSKFSNLDIKILVNENNKKLSEIANDKAEIITVNHRLNGSLIEKYKEWPPVTATYYRTEIPIICKERNFTDKYALYCDYDILCLSDPELYLKMRPYFFQASPEFNRHNFDAINCGVLHMNIENMLKVDLEFLDFMKRNIQSFNVHDQTAYSSFFKGKIDKLSLELNWKPYWGINHQASIVHYHWLKPQTDLNTNPVKAAIENNFKLGDLNIPATIYYQQLWNSIH